MASARISMVRDLLLALVVLALVALNFGHQSAVFAAGGRVVVTAASVCGDPLAPAAGEHFACHACRPDAIAPPPAPSRIEPVCFAATAVAFAPLLPGLAEFELFGAALARAPPAA
jgi:hypothetical protein